MKRILEFPRTLFAVVIMLQTALLIHSSRALWFSDEIRYANAYSNLVEFGKFVVLSLNGEPYPDKPPFYFWVVYLVQSISRLDVPSVMFLTSAVTGFIYLLAHYWFAMTVTQSKKLSVISGLILLTNFYFVGLLNYIRMDLLFAALIIVAYTFMYKFIRTGTVKYVYISYIAASFGALTKGPLACVLPVLFFAFAAVVYRDYRKLLNKHFYIGMAVTMIPIVGWLLGIIVVEGYDFLADLLYTQVYKRAVDTFHHAEPFYYYFYALPLAWLPWALLFFTGGYKELFKHTADFFKRGKGEKYALIAIAVTFAFLSMLSGKISIYALPAFSPIALYASYLFLRTEKRAVFWKSVSLLFAVLGVLLLLLNFLPEIPEGITGNYIAGLAALASAWFIWFYMSEDESTGILTFVLVVTVFFNITGLTLIKGLDDVMSPKRQGGIMKTYIAEGYRPVAYKVYSGLYTYYAGSNVYETKRLDEIAEIASGEKAVIGIAEKNWIRWKEKPENLKIVDKQWIAGKPYLLLIN